MLESVLRVRLHLAGGESPSTQQVLGLPGERVRVDFCWERLGLVVEVDGARWHPDPQVDRERDNLLGRAGWRVLRYGWAEVVHEPERVVGEICAALACRAPWLAA